MIKYIQFKRVFFKGEEYNLYSYIYIISRSKIARNINIYNLKFNTKKKVIVNASQKGLAYFLINIKVTLIQKGQKKDRKYTININISQYNTKQVILYKQIIRFKDIKLYINFQYIYIIEGFILLIVFT